MNLNDSNNSNNNDTIITKMQQNMELHNTTNNTITNDDNDDDELIGISAYFVLFSTLLAIVLIGAKYLHESPKLSTIFPEAGMVLLVGIIAGFFVNYLFLPTTDNVTDEVATNLLQFSPQIFFIFLLPPIIFNSGYHLRRELFFRHFIPICLFAILGTTISAIGIAIFLQCIQQLGWMGNDTTRFQPHFTELLTFGGLISATDPVSTLAVFQAKRVDPQLFYLVFGESVLNDAVGLILFLGFAQFVTATDTDTGKVVINLSEFMISFILDSIGSPLLGLFCGCITALLFKYVDLRETKLLELSLYVLIMYVPFLFAQVIGLSGIVTILFTGMTARAYVVPNLSDETTQTGEMIFRLFAHIAETSLFLELGLSVFGLAPVAFPGKFIFWSFIACLIGRVLNVYPITYFYNLGLRYQPLTPEELEPYNKPARIDEDSSDFSNSSGNHYKENPLHPNVSSSRPNGGVEDETRSRKSKSKSLNKSNIRVSLDPKEPYSETADMCNLSADDTSPGASLFPHVRRDLRIKPKTAHMLCFSALRGAVAYACVRSFPNTYGNRTDFIVTTMVIVLVTVFLFGSTTEAMLNYLKIQIDVDEDRFMTEWYKERRPASFILRLEHYIHRLVVRTDDSRNTQYTQSAGFDHDDDDSHDHDHDDHMYLPEKIREIEMKQLSPTTPAKGVIRASAAAIGLNKSLRRISFSSHSDHSTEEGGITRKIKESSLFDHGRLEP